MIVHASESQHWYTREGEPCYQIKGKNGEFRDTTLRDARKLGLVPSVTTISKCAASPGLQMWQQQQVLMAALTLPRYPGEKDDDYSRRIIHDSKEQARKAAEKGTAIHAAIQGFYEGELVPEGMLGFVTCAVEAVRDISQPSRWTAERAFAHTSGFGGKVDLCSDSCVIDFKSKEFDDPTKKFAYDEHCMQLAAYRHGLGMPEARCANVFVSTLKPGLAVSHEWEESDLKRGWEMFRCLLGYWKAKNKFDPSW